MQTLLLCYYNENDFQMQISFPAHCLIHLYSPLLEKRNTNDTKSNATNLIHQDDKNENDQQNRMHFNTICIDIRFKIV